MDNRLNELEQYIEQLTELVFKRIMDRYGDIYPLKFPQDEEEILLSEMARLSTILNILEEREDFEKCMIVKNRIENIETRLNNL